MIYNEEGSILSVIRSIGDALLPPQYERRIVAINDGSTDASQKVLEQAARTYAVHTIQNEVRQGMPASFTQAFRYLARHLEDDDIVFTLEADGTNDIACVPFMTEKIAQGADVVIASRYAPGAASIGFPRHRLWGSAVVNTFLRWLWDVPNVRDCSVLYRAYRGSLLRRYIVDDIPFAARKSFAVIAEILLHMSRYTSNFAEVPLRYDYSLKKGPSKMKLLRTLWEYTRITPHTPFWKQPIFWIAVGAFIVRLWGLTYGLPDLLIPDEPALTRGALTMLNLHTLIPAFHQAAFTAMPYPPVTAYLFAVVLAPVIGLAYLFSGAASLAQYANHLILDPTVPWIATRVISAFIGALTVYFLGRLSERIYPGSGIYAALFLATSFLHMVFSHIARHWVLSMFFETALIWTGYCLFQSGKMRWYVLSGIFMGLAFGTGVLTVLAGLVPLLAHFFREGPLLQKIRGYELWTMLFLSALLSGIFLALHPLIFYTLLAGPDNHVSALNLFGTLYGLAGMYVIELRDLAQSETAILLFALVGFSPFLYRYRRFGVVLALSILLSIFVLYFAHYYLLHYLTIILPILIIYAGVGAFEIIQMVKKRWMRIAFAICIFALPALIALRISYLWTQPDTRHDARAYIEANLPHDARIISSMTNMKVVWPDVQALNERIAFDPSSSRLVDTTLLSLATSSYPAPAFHVFELRTISLEARDGVTDEWLSQQHFEYAVVDRWATPYLALEALMAKGKIVARFPDGGHTIDILATDIAGHEFQGPALAAFSIKQMGPEVWVVKLPK